MIAPIATPEPIALATHYVARVAERFAGYRASAGACPSDRDMATLLRDGAAVLDAMSTTLLSQAQLLDPMPCRRPRLPEVLWSAISLGETTPIESLIILARDIAEGRFGDHLDAMIEGAERALRMGDGEALVRELEGAFDDLVRLDGDDWRDRATNVVSAALAIARDEVVS